MLEKRLSKRREEFGHGAIEGVAGPEAANNAAAAGILVPLLTLGLPTSATAAVLLAAFQSYGLQPGDRKSVVYGKRGSVRVDLGGRRIIKKKQYKTPPIRTYL